MPAKPPCSACRSEGSGPLWDAADLPVSWRQSPIAPARFPRGQILFHEGTDSAAVYCLKSGMVKLYKTGASGEPYIIRLLGRGRLIGYRAVLADEPFAATAQALADCEACVIPRALFLELLDNSREVAKRLLRHTAWELRVSEEQLLAQAQQSVRERAIRLLSHFLEELRPAGGTNVPIPLPLQRSELAQMIGTTPETLSRVLHKLSESGHLQLSRREIHVRHPERLRAEAARLAGQR